MSLELLGAEEVKNGAPAGGWGGIVGPIMQAAGELAQGGISMYEQHEAENKKADAARQATAAELAAAQAAISADTAAALALARAATSATLKQPSAPIDKDAADTAVRAQDRAAAGLSPAANEKRAKAAETALAAATTKAQANPRDTYSVALMRAWQSTVNKASNLQIVTADAPGGGKGKRGGGGGESWLTRPAVGPVPGYGVVVGGVGILGGLGLVLRKFL